MNNLTSYQLMDRGCRAFVNDPTVFPIGSNTETYTELDFIMFKTDNTTAAKYTFDMGWLPDGATVTFEIEARRMSGSGRAVISIEDRTGYGLKDGRAICSITKCTESDDYDITSVTWTVRPDHNFVTLTITGATADVFQYKFRNPKFKIQNGNAGKRSTIVCCLLRPDNVSDWQFDTYNYINDGFTIENVSTDIITLGFPRVLTGKRPIANATLDYGAQSSGNAPVSASVGSIRTSNLNVAVLNNTGSRSTLNLLGPCRVYISVIY